MSNGYILTPELKQLFDSSDKLKEFQKQLSRYDNKSEYARSKLVDIKRQIKLIKSQLKQLEKSISPMQKKIDDADRWRRFYRGCIRRLKTSLKNNFYDKKHNEIRKLAGLPPVKVRKVK